MLKLRAKTFSRLRPFVHLGLPSCQTPWAVQDHPSLAIRKIADVGCASRSRNHQWNRPWQSSTLLPSSRSTTSRGSHLSPLGGETAAGGRRVGGTGQPLLGPQLAGSGFGVSATAGKRSGHYLAACGDCSGGLTGTRTRNFRNCWHSSTPYHLLVEN